MTRSPRFAADTAASPVVGAILLLAMTVACGTTVWVAVSDPDRVEPMGATAHGFGEDVRGDGHVDTLTLRLDRAPGAPLPATLAIVTEHHAMTVTVDAWSVGDAVRVPCLDAGPHSVTIATNGYVAANLYLKCDTMLHVPPPDDAPRDDDGDDDACEVVVDPETGYVVEPCSDADTHDRDDGDAWWPLSGVCSDANLLHDAEQQGPVMGLQDACEEAFA